MTDVIVCLMGPTASGKTNIACELVKLFPFEIISVDSALIYREMNIGTAKPEKNILAQAPHHLIDVLDPSESYSAAEFCKDTNQLIKEIQQRGNMPLLVGGTMMYFRALQQGLSALPEADEMLRNKFLKEAETLGWPAMHSKLQAVDPLTALRIHPHDSQRIQRALEVFELTGKPLSAFYANQTNQPPRRYCNIALMPANRAWLHERIALRFNQMIADGFIEEVRTLLEKWQLTAKHPSMRSVGYRQAMSYLNNEIDFEALIATGIAATRQLAKRQLTWLRHWPDCEYVEPQNGNVTREIMVIIKKMLDNSHHSIQE